MYNRSLKQRRLSAIQQAIDSAKAYAREQGVPLTAERLAAELEMDLDFFHRVVDGSVEGADRGTMAKVALIQRAFGEATASVMEHAMQRGSSPNMHILYLKNNAGYDPEKGGKSGKPEPLSQVPVVFVGEESIRD